MQLKIRKAADAEIQVTREVNSVELVINFPTNPLDDRYQPEIQTIYGQLQDALGVKVEPAPDEWDRKYNVDFFIQVKDRYIGVQIKPAGYAYITQIMNELEFQKKTHERFTEKYRGKVFCIISLTKGKKKVIYNPEVIEEIGEEIERLKKE